MYLKKLLTTVVVHVASIHTYSPLLPHEPFSQPMAWCLVDNLSFLHQNSTSLIDSTCFISSHFQPIIQHRAAFNQLLKIEIQHFIVSRLTMGLLNFYFNSWIFAMTQLKTQNCLHVFNYVESIQLVENW